MKVRLALVISGLFGLAVLLTVVALTPPEQSGLLPQCLIYEKTGLHCPGCGATRATQALLHLRVGDALKKNVLFVGLLPFALGGMAWGTARWVRGQSLWLPPWLSRAWLPVGVISVTLAFTLLRNLPWYPLTLLAPH